jgi:hypothetical protein
VAPVPVAASGAKAELPLAKVGLASGFAEDLFFGEVVDLLRNAFLGHGESIAHGDEDWCS